MGIAAGVLVVLLLAGGGALALTGFGPVAGLLGGGEGNAPSSGDEPVAKDTGEHPSERATGPAPGYKQIQTPDGGLRVEVPSSWGVETGKDSEKQAGANTWSYYAGEYLNSSITAAPNLDAWYSTGTSGAYVVASKSLAQYTDYELTHSLFYQNKAENCTKGPYKDYNRQPYSGEVQTWFDCGVDSATTYSIAAAPEGRACVVVLDARISEEADREAIEHFMDTFEVDCGRVTSGPVATPTASASASISASVEAQADRCSDPAYKAQKPGVCGTIGYNPASDSGDNYSQGVVVGDDTPDCARPGDVLESGLCRTS